MTQVGVSNIPDEGLTLSFHEDATALDLTGWSESDRCAYREGVGDHVERGRASRACSC